jgi:hypothetical protein
MAPLSNDAAHEFQEKPSVMRGNIRLPVFWATARVRPYYGN